MLISKFIFFWWFYFTKIELFQRKRNRVTEKYVCKKNTSFPMFVISFCSLNSSSAFFSRNSPFFLIKSLITIELSSLSLVILFLVSNLSWWISLKNLTFINFYLHLSLKLIKWITFLLSFPVIVLAIQRIFYSNHFQWLIYLIFLLTISCYFSKCFNK